MSKAQELLAARKGRSQTAEGRSERSLIAARGDEPALVVGGLLDLDEHGPEWTNKDGSDRLDMSDGEEMTSGRSERSVFSSVEAEVVCCGVLMRVRGRAGLSPGEFVAALKREDAAVKFRDSFPMKMGPRETKTAELRVVSVKGGERKQIALTAKGEKSFAIVVGKKQIDSFLGDLRRLNALPGEWLDAADAALVKGEFTEMLDAGNGIVVHFWDTEDGTHFYESLSLAAQAAPGGNLPS